jgi:hypothetical protein
VSYLTVSLLDGTSVATFGPDATERPQAIEGRIDQDQPVRLLFTTSRARAIAKQLETVLVPSADLFNGRPSRAFNGASFAQTLSTGRIVTITLLDDGDDLEADGLLVALRNSVGPGGPKVQELELLFYPMRQGSALYGPAGNVVDSIDVVTTTGSGS